GPIVAMCQQLCHLGNLTPAKIDAREFAPAIKSLSNFRQKIRARLVDGDVIDHGYGGCAYAENVVDIHRYAVNPNRIVTTHFFGDQHFCATTVGGKGDSKGKTRRCQVNDVGKITDWK